MRLNKAFIFLFFIPSALFADNVVTTPINFGKGVDFKNACTDVEDTRACDSSNFVPDRFGAAVPRGGSHFFIDQAVSSQPINSLYRAYISSGATVTKVLIATTGDKIIYSSQTVNPIWATIYSGLKGHNQYFSFVTQNNKVIMTGDALTDPIFQFDVLNSSFSTLISLGSGNTDYLNIRAKYLISTRNYLIAGNIKDVTLSPSTTDYPSRIAYSLLAQPSSFTAARFINIKTEDGESVQGFSEKAGAVEIYKESSIHELAFTDLNLRAFGGDQTVTPIVQGFGLLAPRTLANSGPYDILQSKDGIIRWDGGRKSRLNLSEELLPISTLVQTEIDKTVKSGTYLNSHAIYYPKRQWYVYAYEDPDKFPRGAANSVMIYDFTLGEWFPIKNWLPGCFETLDGTGDNGDLLYGDSVDGYVHWADQEINLNDSRKEVLIDNMDTSTLWTGGVLITTITKEGVASRGLVLKNNSSTMTKIDIINAGEWNDKSAVTTDDKISFKVYPSSLSNLTSLRIDLLFESSSTFTTNFSSVTLSSSSLTGGNTTWSTVEIALSSFPKQSGWVALENEAVPFPNSLTYYGIRFVAAASGDASLYMDDLRLVQAGENPLNPYRLTKQFNFGAQKIKSFRQLILTREKPDNSSIYIDVISNFGKVSNTKTVKSYTDNEIMVYGYNGEINISKLNSVTMETTGKSATTDPADFDLLQGASDDRYIYASDRAGSRLVKIDRSSMTVFVSTFGSLGSGTTNFDTIHQIAPDRDTDNLYVVDNGNNRLKVHNKKTLAFIKSFGTFGTGATNFYNPTGVAVDDNFIWIADDGNSRIMKLSKSTFGYESEVRLDFNTFGETTLAVDENYLYMAYNKTSDQAFFFQDVIVEKRSKSDMSLISRRTLRPENSVQSSTFSLRGDIAILGNSIYIVFTDNGSTYYLQKLLKSNLSLVKELRSSRSMFSVSANSIPYDPATKTQKIDLESKEGIYLQFRYYGKGRDNYFKLLNQAFVIDPRDYRESD